MQKEGQMNLSQCCRLFGISRQGIYQSESREKKRQSELKQVRAYVERVRREMPMLGTRKLHYMLQHDAKSIRVKIGRDALFLYMREAGLLVKRKRKYVQTTNSKHWLRKHPNLLKDRKIQRVEEVFVSDITYVKSQEGDHYLSLVTDAYSRRIMGYHVSNDMNTTSVVQALKMAIGQRKTNKPLIHHSDRGLQYCSKLYQEVLKQNNIKPSMTDGYDCYQNALAERINGILKNEFLLEHCSTFVDLQKATSESIEIYNSRRPHLSLKMKTPNCKHKEDVLSMENIL